MKPIAYTVALLALGGSACAPADTGSSTGNTAAVSQHDAIAAAVAAPTRSADNVARDQYRHPAETLAFFGVEPDDLVVEIWPGGGWYSEILAPYLVDGSLALYASERGLQRMRDKAGGDPATYGNVLFSPADGHGDLGTVPPESADVVLTFRNVHNWAMGDEPYADKMFATMFRMLKPGGTLGVVEHRLPENRPDAEMKSSGYMKQSTVIALAEAAGFELVESSEINANPLDTADHPRGVWTLPPTLRLGEEDREKYSAIGESDRMTLKFRKPE